MIAHRTITNANSQAAVQEAMRLLATRPTHPIYLTAQRWICETCGAVHTTVAPLACDSCGAIITLVQQPETRHEIGSRW